CGADAACAKVWRDVARRSEGSYAAIPQDGGVVAVATPFDKRLGEINSELARSTLVYGTGAHRTLGMAKARAAGGLPAGPAADRAEEEGQGQGQLRRQRPGDPPQPGQKAQDRLLSGLIV